MASGAACREMYSWRFLSTGSSWQAEGTLELAFESTPPALAVHFKPALDRGGGPDAERGQRGSDRGSSQVARAGHAEAGPDRRRRLRSDCAGHRDFFRVAFAARQISAGDRWN